MNTVSDTNCISNYLMPVHNMQCVPLPEEGFTYVNNGTVKELMTVTVHLTNNQKPSMTLMMMTTL